MASRRHGSHQARADAVIYIPAGFAAGAAHRSWNSSATPVRYLDAHVPGPEAYAKLATAQ